jgi:hypothetical protein
METKLILNINEEAIESAKKYAEEHRYNSLSELVEDYFLQLSKVSMRRKTFSPLIESLIGTIEENDMNNLAQQDEKARRIINREE